MSKNITRRTSRPPAPCPRLQPVQSRRAFLRGPQGALGLGLQGPGRPSGPLLAPTPSHLASQSKASPTPRRLTTLKRKLDHTMIIVEWFCQFYEPLTELHEGLLQKWRKYCHCHRSRPFWMPSQRPICAKIVHFHFSKANTPSSAVPCRSLTPKTWSSLFTCFIHYMFLNFLMCVHVCKIQLLPMYVSSTPRDDSSLWGLLTTPWGDLENMKVQSSERISHWTNANCTWDVNVPIYIDIYYIPMHQSD